MAGSLYARSLLPFKAGANMCSSVVGFRFGRNLPRGPPFLYKRGNPWLSPYEHVQGDIKRHVHNNTRFGQHFFLGRPSDLLSFFFVCLYIYIFPLFLQRHSPAVAFSGGLVLSLDVGRNAAQSPVSFRLY